MRLADILTEQRITTALDAADKPSALRAMAHLLAATESTIDETEIVRVFEEREALASTGVGSGVAIPHGRLPGLTRLTAAVGVARHGVDFDAIDGQPAHILVAVLAPERQTGDHLKALARFSRLLRSPRVREQLLEADTAENALEIIVTADGGR